MLKMGGFRCRTGMRGYDVLLRAFGADGSAWPTTGKVLAVVGEDNSGQMRLRMFDADGKKDDWKENKFAPKAALEALKRDYTTMVPHAGYLNGAEKDRVVAHVAKIFKRDLFGARLFRSCRNMDSRAARQAPGARGGSPVGS
jgi:hypothetical protein